MIIPGRVAVFIKNRMPDMLQAIEIMYREGRIPYISDVNKTCLDKVLGYIDDARENNKKILILINGVPGAGKTAVGQSILYMKKTRTVKLMLYTFLEMGLL